MEIKINILEQFFLNPHKGFLIREIAKMTKTNHTTIRKYINYYTKEAILIKKPGKPYPLFSANTESKKYLNLKLYFNLEQIRESTLIEYLEIKYSYPPIILFGSFSKAMDDEKSDIDICLITDTNMELNFENYEKRLKRKISIHQFSNDKWNIMKKKNPELVNSIINGLTLSGFVEVV